MIKLTVVLTFIILLPTLGVSAQEFPADTRPFVNLAYKVKDGDRYVRVGSGTIIHQSGLIITNEHVFNIDEARLDTRFAYVYYDNDNDRHTPPEMLYIAEKLAFWYSAFEAGMHTDVGDGYPDSGLSDSTLQWMVRHALQHDLLLYHKHEVDGDPQPRGKMHDSREGMGRLYRRETRTWGEKTRPKVHESVFARRDGRGDYRPWILEREDCERVFDPSKAEVFHAQPGEPSSTP